MVRTWLEVHRAHGAEACPDVDTIFRAIRRLFPEQPVRRSIDSSEATASATVRVRPTSMGHEALIRASRPREGERIILSRGPECEGLADAIAVALVMLVEPNLAEPSRTTERGAAPNGSEPPASSDASALETVTAPRQYKLQKKPSALPTRKWVTNAKAETSAVARGRTRAGLSALSGGGVGLMSTPSAGVGLGAALSWSSGFGISLNGFRFWSSPAVRAPGELDLDLWAVFGGPCYRMPLTHALDLEGCWTLGAGSQRAESQGYARDGSTRRSWLVSGPRIDLDWRLNRWFGSFASLTGFGHLKPRSFSVEGVGSGDDIVAKAPTLGILLALGLRVEGLVF
jgi:hypothetical protein